MPSQELQTFASDISQKIQKQNEFKDRIAVAQQLAKTYNFSCPELVLFYTYPIYSRYTTAERCAALHITEEQYALFSSEPGFQRFIQDYRSSMMDVVRHQATDSVQEQLKTKRYTRNKLGEEVINLDLEMEVLKGIAAEKAGPQIAVQINNAWGDAREKARALKS